MTVELTCYRCGATASHDWGRRCDCGEPLWVRTDPGEFDWASLADAPGMWRYGPLLPATPTAGLCSVAGGTPLVRASGLDDAIGARVHAKYEGANPTGTFKDRGTALGVAAALDAGVDAVGTVSHGNMARSVAAHAASAGLDCVVLVPADVPAGRLGPIVQYGPTVLRVEGDYGRLYERSLALGAGRGIAFLNADAPLRVEGQKTTALEVVESFAPGGPDAVVLPASSGGHASAVWKALRELREAGVLATLPRLYLVQSAACAPVAAAFEAGAETVTPTTAGETVAYSIANPDPPSGTRALAAARESGGAVLSVDDEEIHEARTLLATRAGLSVEAASATTAAGARRLATRGELSAGDDVVLVATATGLADAPEPPSTVETVPLAGLDERLAEAG